MTIQPAHAHQDRMFHFSTDESQEFFGSFHSAAASPAPSEIVVTNPNDAGPGSLREDQATYTEYSMASGPVPDGHEFFGSFSSTAAAPGPEVIVVTSNADSGPGSLRAALEQPTVGTGKEIQFDPNLAGGYTITLASDLTVPANTKFNLAGAPYLTINGSTIHIDSGLEVMPGLASLTIGSVLAGAGGVTVSGSIIGSLVLSGVNTYTGPTTVTGSTLKLASTGELPADSAVTVNAPGTLDVIDKADAHLGSLSGNGTVSMLASTLTVGGNNTSTAFSGHLGGVGGTLVKVGSGTLALSGNNGSMYATKTTVTGGTLEIQNNNDLGTGIVTVQDGAMLAVRGSSSTISNNITLAGNASIEAGSGIDVTLSGILSGSGGLTKTGSGSLTLTGANTYAGATTVSTGTLVAGGTGTSSLASQSAVTVASGATLSLQIATDMSSLAGSGVVDLGANTLWIGGTNASTVFSGTLNGSGQLHHDGTGQLTLAGSNSGTFSGAIAILGGTLQIASDDNLGSNAVYLGNNATLSVTGSTTIDNAVTAVNSSALNIGINVATGGHVTLAGTLSGTDSTFKKTGAGELTLSAGNNSVPGTAVEGGTLSVTGTLSSTTAINVAAGATLAGTGSITTGTATVQSGGTLSPGAGGSNNGVGTLSINGNLVLASGSTLNAQINGAAAGTGYDTVAVTGTVNINSATLATTHGYTPTLDATYSLIDNDLADGITGTFNALASGGTVTAGGNNTLLKASYSGGTGNDFTLTAALPPKVTSIERLTPGTATTSADQLVYRVTFDQAVNNVDTTDFTVSGGSTAFVTHLNPVTSNSWNVNVAEGDIANYNGSVTLGFAAGQNIQNLTGQALASTTPTGTNDTTYTLDNTAPTLAASTPLDDATGVSTSNNLVLSFSENVTAAEGVIELRKTNGGALVEQFNVTNGEGSLGGTLALSGSTLTLNPHDDLAYDTGYYLLTDFGIVRDAAGHYYNGITNAEGLNFTTGSAPASGGGGGGGTTPPATTVDGVPVTTTQGPNGTTTTVPVVTSDRPDTSGSASPLADIPLARDPGGQSLLQAGVPIGMGLTAEGRPTGGASQSDLAQRIDQLAGAGSDLGAQAQAFLASLGGSTPLTVQTITPTTGAGFNPNVPLVITGGAGNQAIVVDARNLPSGTIIQVDNVEFIAIVGAVRAIGGAGQNVASGDGSVQWIVLGSGNDIIHGGGGNDTVGSEAGDDQVYGDTGDDIVFGGAGNDLLSGGTGSDKLNGGTGFDVAIQEGARTDYTVTLEGAGIKLTHTASGVSDWLVDVEQVRFATGPSLTVAHGAAEEAAAFLFQKWLGRELTQSEGAIIQSLTGQSAEQVASLFAQVFPTQSAGKTPAQLLEGLASAGAIRVDAIREVAVTGDGGNNTVTPTLGLARYVDGGAGTDTVVIPATLAQTHIQANANGSFTLQRMTDGAMLDVTRVERVSFSDTKLALDLNGNAGQAAKLLGALAGPGMLANKGIVGEVIRLLDAGATSQTIAGLGLQLLGANTPAQIAQTLWTNVTGRAGTSGELKILTDILAGGTSAADLVVMAANLDATAVRIDLVGLTAKGIEFA